MAAAIVTGLSDGVPDPPRIVLSPRGADTAAALASRHAHVVVAADNQAVLDGCEVVLVCVRPQDGEALLRDLGFREDQVVISAMAGVHLEQVREWVAPAREVARSIPMPAVAERAGVTPIHPDLPAARVLFEVLGGCVVVADERSFEAMSATSATVAAYYAYLATIAGWLADQGLAAAQARAFVATTFAGAARALHAGAPDFQALVQEVSTPGGLNEQVARSLAEQGLEDAVRRALDAVLERLTT